MSDYFEKLGELLSNVLETGEIPEKKEKDENIANNTETDYREKITIEDKTSEKVIRNKQFFSKKQAIPTGEVIKMHKYTENMYIPPEIQNALCTLDIVYPCTWKDINKKYHQILKELHPDTKNTIQQPESVLKNRQISEIQAAYNLLKVYFKQK